MWDYITKALEYIANKEEVHAQSAMITYYLNDPTTPELVEQIAELPKTRQPFTVDNIVPVPVTEQQQRAAQCHITIANGINYLEKHVRLAHRFPRTKNLRVRPEVGKDFNAFYDGGQLAFFFDRDPVTKNVVFTANSADIVSHELGHAMLDMIRPDLWNVQAFEVHAFHEGFGDIMAIINSLQHDQILQKMLEETGGDLKKSNLATRLAEELGRAVYNIDKNGDPTYLRDISTNFTYTPPSSLPKKGSYDQLLAESHSFGRLIANFWYEVFVGFYELEKKKGTDDLTSLKTARDVAVRLLLAAIRTAPRTSRFYDGFANSMLAVSKTQGAGQHAVVRTVAQKKKILKSQIRMLNVRRWDDLPDKQAEKEVFVEKGLMTIRLPKSATIKIGDYVDSSVSMMSADGIDLKSVEVEIATDSYYEFNRHGYITNEIIPDQKEAIEAALDSVANIQTDNKTLNAKLVSKKNTMWGVEKNKLIRNFVCGI